MNERAVFSKVNYSELERIGRELLLAIGEDPQRAGLLETPRRFAAAWQEFIEYQPGNMDTVFEAVESNQLVVVSGMRVYSLCEHHMLPFWCDVSIGYITASKVLGLSKFARIAHMRAHSLQVQERLVQEIASDVSALVDTGDVAVLAAGEHLCMTMRGVRTPGQMTSSFMGGSFKKDAALRAEFLSLVHKR